MQETIQDARDNRERIAALQRAEIQPHVERAIAKRCLVEALGEYFAELPDGAEADPVCEAYRLILGATDRAKVELLAKGRPAVNAARWARRQEKRRLRALKYVIG